ncbi:UNVERIFIED_CONTAM: hypothetical protein RMT77_019889 [Armadillidium vulgare]
MDLPRTLTFPYLFDDYIFTPIFIKNLLKEATFTSKKVKLTPQEIYLGKREFETNKTYVKALRIKIKKLRRVNFDNRIHILLNTISNYLLNTVTFSDQLKLEWFRFMHLKVLRKEIAKLEDILKQLNISSDAVEAKKLVKEVRLIRKRANKVNKDINYIAFISSYSWELLLENYSFFDAD